MHRYYLTKVMLTVHKNKIGVWFLGKYLRIRVFSEIICVWLREGMMDSKEFALGIFNALARRRRQSIEKITKEELRDFWLQISDQSFDARLQIFFDMWVSIKSLIYRFFISLPLGFAFCCCHFWCDLGTLFTKKDGGDKA